MRRRKEDAEGDMARGNNEGCMKGMESCMVEGKEGFVKGGDLSVWEGEDFFGGAVAEGGCLDISECIHTVYYTESKEGKVREERYCGRSVRK